MPYSVEAWLPANVSEPSDIFSLPSSIDTELTVPWNAAVPLVGSVLICMSVAPQDAVEPPSVCEPGSST